MSWLAAEVTEVAAERILDAAAELFAEQGLNGPGMDAIARAAGCSRATVYRYFENRQALHFAFAHREARRIVELVANRIAGLDDPTERAVEAVLATLAEVRGNPTLLAWVSPGEAGLLSGILRESPLIEGFTARFVGEPEDFPDLELARWLLRVIISFLAMPGTDPAEERRLVERFLAPIMTVR